MNAEQLQNEITDLELRVSSLQVWIENIKEAEDTIQEAVGFTRIKLSDSSKVYIPASKDVSNRLGALINSLNNIKSQLAALS